MKKPTLYMIIGVPGTGKSTLAKKIQQFRMITDGKYISIHEADQYFIDQHGYYRFDFHKLPVYHEACQNAVREALSNGNDAIVSNTNLSVWERKPYFDMARQFHTKVEIIILKKVFGNIHGCSEEKVEKMKKRFDPVFSDEFEGIDSVTFVDYNYGEDHVYGPSTK